MQILPSTGFIRQAQLLGDPKADPPIPAIIPVSSSTFWRWVATNRFPKPVKKINGSRATFWRCEDVRAWLDQQTPEADAAAAQ